MTDDELAPVVHLSDHRGDRKPVEPELVQDDRDGLAYKVRVHGRYVGGVWSEDGGLTWRWIAGGVRSSLTYDTPGAATDALLTNTGARP